MIKAHCFTNIDAHRREEWPTQFVALPREGDWVESLAGTTLRVSKVTHYMSRRGEPGIRVELTKLV